MPKVGAMVTVAQSLALASIAIAAACHRTSPTPSDLTALPSNVSEQTVALGDSIFHVRACRRCHGLDGKGTVNGPDLTDPTWLQISGTYESIVAIITSGVPMAKI